MVNQAKTTSMAYWIITILVAVLFIVPGIMLLLHVPHFTQDMAHLGYPIYFLAILGVWKILAAITIVAPRLQRLKEWAYAGLVFDASSAAISRASVGDDALKIIAPLAITALVLLSWKLRPADRTLKS